MPTTRCSLLLTCQHLPPTTQSSWDGLTAHSPSKPAHCCLLANTYPPLRAQSAFSVTCPLLITHHPLLTAYGSLLATGYPTLHQSLASARCLLLTADHSLLATLLSDTYSPLSTCHSIQAAGAHQERGLGGSNSSWGWYQQVWRPRTGTVGTLHTTEYFTHRGRWRHYSPLTPCHSRLRTPFSYLPSTPDLTQH